MLPGVVMALSLEPVSRRTVADEVFDQLAEQILDGRLSVDAALPGERTLSDQLGVNRQAIREAVQRLAQAGLVDVRQGGATKVCDFRRTAGLDLLHRLLVRPDGTPDGVVIRSVMELRATLGPDIAGRCAERAVPALVAALRAAFTTLAAADPADAIGRARLDLAFWECLVDGADNVAYRLAYNSLRQVYEPALAALAPVLAGEIGDLTDHEAIVQAVETGDALAAQDAAWALLARGSAAIAELMVALAEARR
jgi:GntR family transcriptional repressor for pyruvate dehydrogenase complex